MLVNWLLPGIYGGAYVGEIGIFWQKLPYLGVPLKLAETKVTPFIIYSLPLPVTSSYSLASY